MPQWVFRDACGRSHWGIRWSSLWGHETLHLVGENATLGVRDACGRWHWGLWWNSLWGHETLQWVGENAKLGVSGRTRTVPVGASVELLVWPRND
eukprot:25908-Pyramimonas_sp.AAC.1